MITADVAPVFQEYVLPPVAVSVVTSPIQRTVFPFTETTGPALTVTVVLVTAVHPFTSVIVTVYPDVAAGFTV